jgi:Domain of unknown function(DUF2779)
LLLDYSYLPVPGEDPQIRPNVLLRDHGHWNTRHNATFERGRLQELTDPLPPLRNRMDHLGARIVDLGSIAKAHYYHRSRISSVRPIDGKI